MKILTVCGSPRKGNSETISNKMKNIFGKNGINNEIILLREKNIERCDGCVEYCNKNLSCHKKDDMNEILKKMDTADAYVFIAPNYFKMPPGIFKDFIDRCSVLYTAGTDLTKKQAIVLAVGTDELKEIDVCLNNVTENFCKTLGICVVGKKSFRSISEIKGNYNNIFENDLNKNIENDLEILAKKIQN